MINKWDIYAIAYDTIINQTSQEYLDYLKSYLNDNDIILDAACGTGTLAIELSKNVKRIYATDLSQKMIETSKKKIKKNQINNIITQRQDIYDIKFDDNTFDVAIAANIIHLLDKRQKAMDELKRVVKKDGLIIMPTYTVEEKSTLEKIKLRIIKTIGFESNSWTEKEYIRTLNEHNLDIIDYQIFKTHLDECVVIIRNRK